MRVALCVGQALKHPYFTNDPPPTPPEKLPRPRHVESEPAPTSQGQSAPAMQGALASLGLLRPTGINGAAKAGATLGGLSRGGAASTNATTTGAGAGAGAGSTPGSSGVATRLNFG